MPNYIDIGVNLVDKSFDADREQVVERAIGIGMCAMVLTGTSVERSEQAAALAEERPGFLYSTAGVHPHDAKSITSESIPVLRDLCQKPHVVAVGECGLDFNRNYSPKDSQIEGFCAQLELAAELKLPVFIHERDASTEMIATLREYRPRISNAVIHCFTGDEVALRAYLDLDLHIGITGWICDERRGTHLIDLVTLIPNHRLMLETDAPYLLPRTKKPRPKSRRNEPANITYVAETLAQARGVGVAELAESTTQTARAFFALDGQLTGTKLAGSNEWSD